MPRLLGAWARHIRGLTSPTRKGWSRDLASRKDAVDLESKAVKIELARGESMFHKKGVIV